MENLLALTTANFSPWLFPTEILQGLMGALIHLEEFHPWTRGWISVVPEEKPAVRRGAVCVPGGRPAFARAGRRKQRRARQTPRPAEPKGVGLAKSLVFQIPRFSKYALALNRCVVRDTSEYMFDN